jgi:hypothetical protein
MIDVFDALFTGYAIVFVAVATLVGLHVLLKERKKK